MLQIPRVSQVPIIEPMYTNGVMNTTWVRFFEKLASMLNVGELADLVTLLQLASQLPTQSAVGQMMLDMPPMTLDSVPMPVQNADLLMPVVPIFNNSTQTFDSVTMPTSEVITP